MEKEKMEALALACDKKEAVFYKQIGTLFKDSIDFESYLSKVQEYINKVGDYGDDRLLALVADLLVESTVDNYLSEIMPNYNKELSDNKAFTFSLKIDIAMALRFSPKRYFEAAHIIRKIRNEFAHNLNITTFHDLKPELINKFECVFDRCLPFSETTYPTTARKYKALTRITVISFFMYARHLRLLNAYLRDDSFYENLTAFSIDKKTDEK